MAKGSLPRQKIKIDGKTRLLAVVTKGRDIPKAEKIKIASSILELYKTDNYTLPVACEYCGISYKTLQNWIKQISEISDLYKDALEEKEAKYKANLKTRALTLLEKLLTGYVVEVKEVHKEFAEKDGKSITLPTRKEIIKQIYVKPTPSSAYFVLTKLDPGNFPKDPAPDTGPEIPTEIKINIANNFTPPVTREEDIKEVEE